MRVSAVLAVAALGFLALPAGSARAGASSQNVPPPTDPTAKNLAHYVISLRAFDACLIGKLPRTSLS